MVLRHDLYSKQLVIDGITHGPFHRANIRLGRYPEKTQQSLDGQLETTARRRSRSTSPVWATGRLFGYATAVGSRRPGWLETLIVTFDKPDIDRDGALRLARFWLDLRVLRLRDRSCLVVDRGRRQASLLGNIHMFLRC